jgi:hypothetical protein
MLSKTYLLLFKRLAECYWSDVCSLSFTELRDRDDIPLLLQGEK